MTQLVAQNAHAKAHEVDARAAAWIERRDRGNWAKDDEAAFDVWLNEDPVHRLAYWRAESVWDRTERLIALRLPEDRHHRRRALFRIAAASVLAGVLGAGVWAYLSRPVGVTYATSIGGRETIMLADHTQIELNTNTAVRVLDTSRDRKIWLQKGEAYFQVAHDRSRPLTVYAGDQRVVDIGTKFDVRRQEDKLEVIVVEGRVRFNGMDTRRVSHTLVLSQGDAVVVEADKMALTRKSRTELPNELGWRRGVLVFDNTPLSDAVSQIGRYNSTKIVIADASAARQPVTGTLSATDPEEFLRMIRTVFGLHEQRLGDEIVISR